MLGKACFAIGDLLECFGEFGKMFGRHKAWTTILFATFLLASSLGAGWAIWHKLFPQIPLPEGLDHDDLSAHQCTKLNDYFLSGSADIAGKAITPALELMRNGLNQTLSDMGCVLRAGAFGFKP